MERRPLHSSSPSNARNYLYYLVLLAVFGEGIWFILATGSKLNSRRPLVSSPSESVSVTTSSTSAIESATPQTYLGRIFKENLRSPLSILLLQIIVIIIAAYEKKGRQDLAQADWAKAKQLETNK